MERNIALERWNTEVKLVCIISNHSSSFIRINKLSRVIPALFTRISISPNCSLICSNTASMLSLSATFNTKPLPLSPR